MRRKFLKLLLAGVATLGAPVTFADHERRGRRLGDARDDDFDIYNARKLGRIRPLNEIRKQVAARIRGRIIEIEFEYKHGRPVYEFKYVTPQGRLREMYVDARTGKMIRDKEDD